MQTAAAWRTSTTWGPKRTRLRAPPPPSAAYGETSRSNVDPAPLSADESSQIAARLRLTPSERLRYLEDMLAFEALAARARRLT
jgi:hypothetical protein